MNGQSLLTYMNLLDDVYIEEANPHTSAKKAMSKAKSWHRFSILVAAIVALLAMLIVAVFASFGNWSSYLSLVFEKDIELLDAYTIAAKNVKYTSTNNQVNMEVIGYTGDLNFAYVWIKMTLPQDVINSYNKDDIKSLGVSVYEGNYCKGQFVGGELNGNIYTFGLHMPAYEINTFPLAQTKITLKNVTIYFKDDSYNTIHGEWSAKFKIELPDIAQEFNPSIENIILHMSEDPNDRETLGSHFDEYKFMKELHPQSCHVLLTPMSVRFTIFYDNPDNFFFDSPRIMRFVMSDGSVKNVTILYYTSEHYNGRPDKKELIGLFDEPLNLNEVVAIEYAGARISLK